MPASHSEHQQWARRGASVRLAEIEAERAAILKAFPELKGARPHVLATARRRRPSVSARKRMSEGMRKYWARRKAQAKAQSKA